MNPCDCGQCWIRANFKDYLLPTPCARERRDEEPTQLGGWNVEEPPYVSVSVERGGP